MMTNIFRKKLPDGDSAAVSMSWDQFLLRRRFGPSDYGLYQGDTNPATFSLLSVFRPPCGKTTNDFIAIKFYRRKSINSNLDITDVYFDKNYIYVENATRLFYHETEWHRLEMLGSAPLGLTIRSIPSDAVVTMQGEAQGKTPLIIRTFTQPFAAIQVAKSGFCRRSVFTPLSPGSSRDITVVLPKKNDNTENRTRTLDKARNLCALAEYIDQIQDTLHKIRHSIDQDIGEWGIESALLTILHEHKSFKPSDEKKQYRSLKTWQTVNRLASNV
ncbi:MAG: hypothetical protein GF344_13770, partial [Chitinivibrionales bacterium]|nr:hypothetical protein [Chitinivibrionales bacterium]MBD3357798.1 hypothetical protein [Chitinivibrionales bacterium]